MDRKSRVGHAGHGITSFVAALLVASCQAGSHATPQDPLEFLPGGISPTVRAVFDSASAAFVAGDAPLAGRLFSAVLAEDSSLAAAWVGLYLAEQAMAPFGRNDSALVRARSLMEPPPRPRGRGQPSPGT